MFLHRKVSGSATQGGLAGRLRVALLVVLVSSPHAGAAQTSLSGYQVAVENDGLALWIKPDDRQDWYYTHGLQVTVTRPTTPGLWWKGVGGCDGSWLTGDDCAAWSLGMGQMIFTPRALFVRSPPDYDRPYAGWLYVRFEGWRVQESRVETVGLELGITGEASGGQAAHEWFHRTLDKPKPRGWHSQLPFEVAGTVSYRWVQRINLVREAAGFALSIEPGGEGSVGTARTAIGTGLALRVGWNAPRTLEFNLPAERGFHVLFRAEIGRQHVVRDLFVDGSLWRESGSAVRIPTQTQTSVRLTVGWPAVGLELGASRSSPEFDGQQGDDHQRGSIALSIRR